MEVLKKLKTAPIPQVETQEEQLKFLEDSDLNRIVNKGLAELYRIQPPNPITFLSQWLLNESYSKTILNQISKDNQLKEETMKKKQEEEEYLAKVNAEQQAKEKEENDKKEKLKELITTSDDYDRDLNEICERIKEIIGATGVYVMKYDLKRKKVESIDEDENAHIDPENIKVLRFIAWNKDHEFLHGQFIEPKKGVTYPLFLEKGEGEEDDEEGGDEGDKPEEAKNEEAKAEDEGGEEDEEGAEKKEKPDVIKTVIINDVVNAPKIKFFREPRLGAYMAYNITYQSSLNYKSLLSAIDCLTEYQNKKEEEEKRKAEREGEEGAEGTGANNNEEEEENNEEEKEENREEGEGEEGEKDDQNEKDQPITLADFEKEEKVLVLSMDTLGQDRTFSDSQKAFAMEMAKLIRDSIQNHEKTLLEKDRDLRIEYLKVEKPLIEEWNQDKIDAEKENAVRDYTNSDEYLNKNITEETHKKVESDYARANSIIQSIVLTDFLTLLQMFEKFEFVEYEPIFQNVLYFARVEPQEINFPETNALSWKLARTKWSAIFDILKDYNPLGPKPGKVLSIFKGNIILNKLLPYMEEEKYEEIKTYSYALSRLLEYVVSILKVRKDDIILRHTEQKEKIKERNEIIKNNELIDAERKKALAKAKAQFAGKELPEEEEKGDEAEGEEGGEEKEEEKEEEDEKKDEGEEEKEGEEKKEGEENKEGEEHKEGEEVFNEEEWGQLYDQEHPKAPVPDEIEIDLDEDFDVEEVDDGDEGEGEEEEQKDGDDKDKEKDAE